MDTSLIIGLIAAFFLGLAKGGLKGIGMLTVALTAIAYGAKNSTGIVLPLLIVGDILAVIYFKEYVKWKYLRSFLPWIIVGVLVATYFGKDLPEASFKQWMGGVILASVGLMLVLERRTIKVRPEDRWLGSVLGFITGFTTMIGNLAAPFANLYFLATRLPKNEILGTAAWTFFIVNTFKVPFHIFSWGTINWSSLKIDLFLLPAVFVGFAVGIKIVNLFSETFFRQFLLVVTAIGALLIFLK